MRCPEAAENVVHAPLQMNPHCGAGTVDVSGLNEGQKLAMLPDGFCLVVWVPAGNGGGRAVPHGDQQVIELFVSGIPPNEGVDCLVVAAVFRFGQAAFFGSLLKDETLASIQASTFSSSPIAYV